MDLRILSLSKLGCKKKKKKGIGNILQKYNGKFKLAIDTISMEETLC